MARAHPQPGLRPFVSADVPMLAEIFRDAIEELTGEDYSEGQQAEWAASVEDEAAFGSRLAGQLTLVATVQGSPVAFVSLKGVDEIDMLYVHSAVARQGLATLLLDAIEKLAGARGARRLTVDASDTARDLFEKRGFKPQRRNTVARGREWLGNTTMEKPLSSAGGQASS